jgi:hypothetical protein
MHMILRISALPFLSFPVQLRRPARGYTLQSVTVEENNFPNQQLADSPDYVFEESFSNGSNLPVREHSFEEHDDSYIAKKKQKE